MLACLLLLFVFFNLFWNHLNFPLHMAPLYTPHAPGLMPFYGPAQISSCNSQSPGIFCSLDCARRRSKLLVTAPMDFPSWKTWTTCSTWLDSRYLLMLPVVFALSWQLPCFYFSIAPVVTLKGYSSIHLIHGLTHHDTELDPPLERSSCPTASSCSFSNLRKDHMITIHCSLCLHQETVIKKPNFYWKDNTT